MKRRINIIFKLDDANQAVPRVLDTVIDTEKGESYRWSDSFVTVVLDGGDSEYTYPTQTVSRIKTTVVGKK